MDKRIGITGALAAILTTAVCGSAATATPSFDPLSPVPSAPESAPSGTSSIVEITVDGTYENDPVFIFQSMLCPADHPYLVLDDAGPRNSSAFFRSAEYRLADGEHLRVGEYVVPIRTIDGSANFTGANVRVQAQNWVIAGHSTITLFCSDTREGAHQNWR